MNAPKKVSQLSYQYQTYLINVTPSVKKVAHSFFYFWQNCNSLDYMKQIDFNRASGIIKLYLKRQYFQKAKVLCKFFFTTEYTKKFEINL